MKRLLLVASSVLTFGITACGGGDEPSLSGFFAEVEDIFCDYEVGCGYLPDRAACEAQLRTEDARAEAQNAIDDGRLSFDGGKVEACLRVMRSALSCSVAEFGVAGANDPCDEVMTGLVPAGGTCYGDDECAGDAACEGNATVAECTPGVCVAVDPEPPPVGAGGDCTDARCQPGLFCRRTDDGARTCTPLAGDGAPCQGLGSCARGLACNGGVVGTGTCYDPPARGEQCDPQLGFVACDVVTDLCDPVDGVCTAAPRPGDPCNPDDDQCIRFAFCNSEGRCEQKPGVGDACTYIRGIPECLGNLECVYGTCMPSHNPVCLP